MDFHKNYRSQQYLTGGRRSSTAYHVRFILHQSVCSSTYGTSTCLVKNVLTSRTVDAVRPGTLHWVHRPYNKGTPCGMPQDLKAKKRNGSAQWPTGFGDFPFSHGCGVHPASHTLHTSSSTGNKAAVAWSWPHLEPRLRTSSTLNPLPLYAAA